MKNITTLSIFTICILGLSACGNTNNDLENINNQVNENDNDELNDQEELVEEVDEKTYQDFISDDFVLEFDTGIEIESVILDEDYEKYNAIMDELSSDWDRSEQEIYEDIANDYDSTAEELEVFMRKNSQAAIDRDFLGGTFIDEEDLNSFVHEFLNTNFDAEIDVYDFESEITSYRATSHFNFKLVRDEYEEEHEGILNFDYNVDDNYGSAKAFQFYIDDDNIDQVSD